MKKGSLFLFIFLIFLIGTSVQSSGVIYGPPPSEDRPVLQVRKTLSDDQVYLGNNVTVYLNITNWSTKTAFNLSITEPIFNNWSITDFIGYDNYIWTEIQPLGSISYQYQMTLLAEGNYTIKGTVIDYVDENGTSYVARSADIDLFVFTEEPLPDFTERWNTILLMSTLIIAVPVMLLLLNNWLFKRR